MEINTDNNCIPLHAHLKDEEEGIHKEQGCETYCEKQWRRWHWSYIPTYSTNQPLKVTMLGWYKTNTLLTWHTSDIHLLTMHVAHVNGHLWSNLCKHQIVVILTCPKVYMQEDVIHYYATWYIWIWSWKHGTHVYRPMAYSRWFGLFQWGWRWWYSRWRRGHDIGEISTMNESKLPMDDVGGSNEPKSSNAPMEITLACLCDIIQEK